MSDSTNECDGRARERLAPSARELALRTELLMLRHELRGLLTELEQLVAPTSKAPESAVVTSVIARTALLYSSRDE